MDVALQCMGWLRGETPVASSAWQCDGKEDVPKPTNNSASVRESSENTFACQAPCVGGGKLLETGNKRRDAVQRQCARCLTLDEVQLPRQYRSVR